ncbi:MAG: hypothetical protein Ct9H90mP4_05120 [Gammaproteobacteria bacterium]|nr:MAG: hypothetical protein Ct9H90mP4_05120 [Gammaproteobacteria bacterium]
MIGIGLGFFERIRLVSQDGDHHLEILPKEITLLLKV